MRFYDPIMAMIKEDISDDMQSIYSMKNQLNVRRLHFENGMKNMIAKFFGFEKLDSN